VVPPNDKENIHSVRAVSPAVRSFAAVAGLMMFRVLALLVGLGVLMGLVCAVDVGMSRYERTTGNSDLTAAKQLGLACKLYAGDHEGNFPPNLEVLVPEYCPAEAFEGIGRSRARRKLVPFTYLPGQRDDGPPDLPLIVGPTSEKDRYVVVTVDQSAEICELSRYSRYLKRYREWIVRTKERDTGGGE
jgi:hypothetical protein